MAVPLNDNMKYHFHRLVIDMGVAKVGAKSLEKYKEYYLSGRK